MINKTILVGRLTKDIDLKKTPNGASVVSFTLAVNRRVKQEGQPDADFINCVAWNKVADLMHQYLKKGALIGLEGRIQTRSYDDKGGKTVYITEVVVESVQFLETKKPEEGQSSNWSKPQHTPTVNGKDAYEEAYGISFESNDLPF